MTSFSVIRAMLQGMRLVMTTKAMAILVCLELRLIRERTSNQTIVIGTQKRAVVVHHVVLNKAGWKKVNHRFVSQSTQHDSMAKVNNRDLFSHRLPRDFQVSSEHWWFLYCDFRLISKLPLS